MDNYIIYPKQLRKQIIPVEKNRCFFLMPFSEEFDGIYGVIKQCLNDAGFICNRADEIAGSTPILTKILNEIMKSQYIIVDLTNSNPNVFYELGIAHTIKEARNVLLLKQKDYKVPFDINHLTYTEYNPNNLKFLTASIRSFLNESKSKNMFYEALNQHGIISYIDENNNDFIEILLENLDDENVICLTNILLNESKDIAPEKINRSMLNLRSIVTQELNNRNYEMVSKLLNVYYEELRSLKETDIARTHIEQLINDYFDQFSIDNALVKEYKTRLALILAKQELYMDIVLPWILNYFSRSKTATIDLNRYNVESFLMTTTSEQINNAIINGLCDSDCYIREHMSDIIGEKRLISGASLLYVQLAKEENYFTAQSMMEAIGKLKQPGGIEVIKQWINIHKDNIIKTKQLFVLKHAFIAITKLDLSTDKIYITEFKNEFDGILKNYYII